MLWAIQEPQLTAHIRIKLIPEHNYDTGNKFGGRYVYLYIYRPSLRMVLRQTLVQFSLNRVNCL